MAADWSSSWITKSGCWKTIKTKNFSVIMCFWKSIIGDDMDRFDPPKFIECDIDDHLEAFESTRKLRSFVFRGHRESNWELSSSFFREYEKYPKNQVMESAERMTIDYFKKRHHLYQLGLQGAPDLKDILASMQHHGCPTRLIDFTKSFSVATYFAVNDAAFNGNPYSIWAVNLPVIKCASVAAIGSTFDFEKTFFAFPQTNPLSVLAFEPSMLSRRMSTQQGILLVQMNIRETFLKNLCSMAKISEVPVKINYDDYKSIDQNSINNVAIIKFNFISRKIQPVKRELIKSNVTSENLFPDLNGLARSSVEHIFWEY